MNDGRVVRFKNLYHHLGFPGSINISANNHFCVGVIRLPRSLLIYSRANSERGSKIPFCIGIVYIVRKKNV